MRSVIGEQTRRQYMHDIPGPHVSAANAGLLFVLLIRIDLVVSLQDVESFDCSPLEPQVCPFDSQGFWSVF